MSDPDPRDPHAEVRRQERVERYHEAMDEYRATDPQARTLAIAHCTLCDGDGYTPARRICDHRDHWESTAGGRAAVQAELDKIRARRSGAA